MRLKLHDNSVMDYCAKIVAVFCFAMLYTACSNGEDIVMNGKRIVLASDIQAVIDRGEAIHVNCLEVRGPLEIRSCKDLSLKHCQIDRLVFRGIVSGDVDIYNCTFENETTIGPGVVILGALKISRSVFKTSLWINDAEVSNGVLIEEVKLNEGIEIEKLRSTQMNLIDIQDQGVKVDNALKDGIPFYRTVKVKDVVLSGPIRLEGVNVPAINVMDCFVESCVIKENKIDELVLNNVNVQRDSYIDFQIMPILGMKLVESNFGQHVRFKLPCHIRGESKIDLSGTVGNFDSLPPPNQLLPMLRCGNLQLEYRQTLAMLYKAYEASGNLYDANSVYEEMAKFDASNSHGMQKPRLYIHYFFARREAEALIIMCWAGFGVFGFIAMIFVQGLKGTNPKILVDYEGSEPYPSKNHVDISWRERIKIAAMAAMDGVMPIHISGKYHCYGVAYLIYAFLKVISWLMIMLFAHALAF